jgi:predicted Zn-dependent protease
MFTEIKQRFRKVLPDLPFCSLRYVEKRIEHIAVRNHVAQPPHLHYDTGIMVTLIENGGMGYAATSDLSIAGMYEAIIRARQWAQRCRYYGITNFSKMPISHPHGEYRTPVAIAWSDHSMADKFDMLQRELQKAPHDSRLVDAEISLESIETQQYYLTNGGGEVYQHIQQIVPHISFIANEGMNTQRRSFAAHGYSQQGGMEILNRVHFYDSCPKLAEEALVLLDAPDCPTDTRDLVLAPDQMLLQLHESIGHPLELDRILGDERNYAGTSFVTLDMFGHYQYGSPLLNVTFDPSRAEEFASYGFDDDGSKARKTYLIREGLLETPLGSISSQYRAGISGVANARASSWNRPPIDRMANLNIEAGESRFSDIISNIEKGVFMRTNISWSIDDSRNKFQFGCEWGRLIENGELTQVVKNPNYRGVSATFWRNLSQVGNQETFEILGTPFCGKGEPNQVIQVGHASPVCAFTDVEVFGGA